MHATLLLLLRTVKCDAIGCREMRRPAVPESNQDAKPKGGGSDALRGIATEAVVQRAAGTGVSSVES